jgi:hypothetical protein
MKRPTIDPKQAFEILKNNKFEDTDIDDTTSVSIEPGHENVIENMLAIVYSSKAEFLNLFAVDTENEKWVNIN